MRSSILDILTHCLFTLLILTNATQTTTLISLPEGIPTTNNILNCTKVKSCPLPARRTEPTHSLSIYRTTSSKRHLVTGNGTNIRMIIYEYETWYSFPPSPATAELLLSFYANIRDIALRAMVASGARDLCFFIGALYFTLSCSSQSISRDIVNDIMRYMEMRVRSGFLGLGKLIFYMGKVSGLYIVSNVILRAALFRQGLPLHNIVLNGRDGERIE